MTNPSPPNSCFVDGVQFTTGCTMGKGNIKLRKGKDVSVLFSKDDKKLRLKLKKEMLKSIESISSEEAAKDTSLNLLNRSAYELFEIKR
jgi:formylmethanofuran dehydrogenase subunit E